MEEYIACPVCGEVRMRLEVTEHIGDLPNTVDVVCGNCDNTVAYHINEEVFCQKEL